MSVIFVHFSKNLSRLLLLTKWVNNLICFNLANVIVAGRWDRFTNLHCRLFLYHGGSSVWMVLFKALLAKLLMLLTSFSFPKYRVFLILFVASLMNDVWFQLHNNIFNHPKKVEHRAEIFLGTWPTITPAFITATAYGSWTFITSLWHCNSSPKVASQIDWYWWYPLIIQSTDHSVSSSILTRENM